MEDLMVKYLLMLIILVTNASLTAAEKAPLIVQEKNKKKEKINKLSERWDRILALTKNKSRTCPPNQKTALEDRGIKDLAVIQARINQLNNVEPSDPNNKDIQNYARINLVLAQFFE